MSFGDETLDAIAAEVRALIARLADGSRDDDARDALLVRLLAAQAERCEPYGRLVARRPPPGDGAPGQWPAVPTDVFRHARVACHAPGPDVRVFRTSGTTQDDRGAHAFADLSLYDDAARTAAAHALFHDTGRFVLVVLAARPEEAPDSSLSYMLGQFGSWFGDGPTTWVLRDGQLDVPRLERALTRAEQHGTPVAVLGTSFAFVHAEEAFAAQTDAPRFRLPPKSRIMQTGGFKGRSREVAPEEMRALLSARFGLDARQIVSEYGMTELSSQMYETTLIDVDGPRRLWVPGWVRATPVDPESLEPVAPGETGILRIDDLANVGSVAAIQTSDLARAVEDGIEVLGRAPGAVPRGCSLAVDAALGG